MHTAITYSDPQVCHYDHDMTRGWFVHFKITNEATGEVKRLQFRGTKMNRLHRKADRVKAANMLRLFWKQRLEYGWHPFEVDEMHQLISPLTPFNQALDFALDKCKVATKSYSDYSVTVRFFKEGAKACRVAEVPVKRITRQHILTILEWLQKKKELTNHAYNKHASYIRSVLSRLGPKHWRVMESNPASELPVLATAETQKYKPYTDEERKRIAEHLSQVHPNFLRVVLFIFHTGIRPKEALSLKVKDIDLNECTITIVPDLEVENSKVKTIRRVPMIGDVVKLFDGLQDYDKELYVFGSPFESRGGYKGVGMMHPDYFIPSSVMVKRDTITKLWNRLIMHEKTGIGIKKHLYAAKHTGADAKIMAGIDLDALRQLYGHASKYMTEKYAQAVKDEYRKQIMEKSPGF